MTSLRLMALGRVGLVLMYGLQEPHNYRYYCMRFFGFVLILVGIINKNRASRQ